MTKLYVDKRAAGAVDLLGESLIKSTENAHLDPIFANTLAGGHSRFEMPTFTERFHGWNDDGDTTSNFTALPAFLMHAVNGIRLARVLVYMKGVITCSFLPPVLELAQYYLPLAQCLDQDAPSNVSNMLQILSHMSNWWKCQVSASRSVDGVCSFEVMRLVHEWSRNVLANPDSPPESEREFYKHTWWLLPQFVSGLLSSNARMLAAAGTMISTYLYEYPIIEEEEPSYMRKIWRFCWDANMHYLTQSGMTINSECQYRGLGRVADPNVYMPVFDGTLSRSLELAIQQSQMVVEHKASKLSRIITSSVLVGGARSGGGGGGAEAGATLTAEKVNLTMVSEDMAYRYSKKLFIMFVVRGQELRAIEERGTMYLPPIRWDFIFPNLELKHGVVDVTVPPKYLPLFVNLHEGKVTHAADTGASHESPTPPKPYSQGIINTGHMVEVFKMAEWEVSSLPKAKVLRRKAKKAAQQQTAPQFFKCHVRTVMLNPACWGPFGCLH